MNESLTFQNKGNSWKQSLLCWPSLFALSLELKEMVKRNSCEAHLIDPANPNDKQIARGFDVVFAVLRRTVTHFLTLCPCTWADFHELPVLIRNFYVT